MYGGRCDEVQGRDLHCGKPTAGDRGMSLLGVLRTEHQGMRLARALQLSGGYADGQMKGENGMCKGCGLA